MPEVKEPPNGQRLRKFSIEQGMPSCLLVDAPPPDLVGVHDTETDQVTLYSVSGGKHVVMPMDRCRDAFNGDAFVFSDDIEIPKTSVLVTLESEQIP